MTLRRKIAASLVVTLSAVVAVACGAGRSSEAPASAPEKSAPAADESTTQSAPTAGAPAQAPAYAPPPAEEAPRGYGAPPAPAPAPRKPAGPSSTRSEAESDDSSDFGLLTSQFERALALSTPDCTLSWALRDKICDLSQRLCDLAARSAEPEMDGRCRDGRARCEHATSRVRAVCAE